MTEGSGVCGRNLVQAALAASQDEGETVIIRGLREGGKPGPLQQGVEFGHAVLAQQEHGRYVEGTGQGLIGGHGAVKLPVKILRGKTSQVHRHVRQQRPGQNLALLQRRGIQERLQDAAGRAGRGGNVHLRARPFALRRGVPHVGHYLSAGVVHDHGGHIGHSFLGQFVGLPVHQGRYGFLQRQPQRSPCANPLGTALHIVRSIGRKRQGSVRQRFLQRRFIGIGR